MPAKPKPQKPTTPKLALSPVAKKPRAVAAKAAAKPAAKTPIVKLPLPAPVAVLKPAPVPQPAIATANPKPASATSVLKKKDLIDKVVASTGAKPALVRDIIEATLSVLGDALSKGAMLNLPPLGKAKVNRPSDAGSGKAMTIKLRLGPVGGQNAGQSAAAKSKQTLAEPED